MSNAAPSGRHRRPVTSRRLTACCALATLLAAPLVAAPPAWAAAGCSVTYKIASQWSGGFVADVAVTNSGSDPWSSWTVTWDYDSGQLVTNVWNSTVSQSGGSVTATNAPWNGSVAAGGTTSFGFQGTFSAPNPVPGAFSVNGTPCGQVVTPTTTTTTTTSRPTTTTTTTSRPTGQLVVSTSGSDSNPGTVDAPLRTIQKAIDLASPGSLIEVRGGTYMLSSNLQVLKSGTSSAPITLRNWTGERVVVDGEPLPYTPGAVGSTIPRSQRGSIHMEASWWLIAGLELVNGPYGIYCDSCNNNRFERLVTHDNYESGFQLQGSSSNNLILNLDSYGNRDPRKNGESADGLAIKEGSGSGIVVRGARLWNNVDDGPDFWMFASAITVESSVAWGNGENRWASPTTATLAARRSTTTRRGRTAGPAAPSPTRRRS